MDQKTVQKGERWSAATANGIIRALNAGLPVTAGPGLLAGGNNGTQISLASLTNSGVLILAAQISDTGPLGTEIDFTDEQYWCDLQQNVPLQNQSYSFDELNLLTVDTVIAYNLQDADAHSHTLAVGTYVTIGLVGLGGPIAQWVILASGGGSLPIGQYSGQGLFLPSDNVPGIYMFEGLISIIV